MAKDKIAYVCDNCGQESTKWLGKCPSCHQWNTFREIRISGDSGQQSARTAARSVASAAQGNIGAVSHALHLRDIPLRDVPRMDMHDAELNRVLGGGLVPGSIILLG
ncbi:MAG: DNA repair protein RadA, partial [Prevotella sp.]|nr:DNA repair protein RadA [Prevotella sp.]